MITLNKRFKTPVRKIFPRFILCRRLRTQGRYVVVNCFACVGRYTKLNKGPRYYKYKHIYLDCAPSKRFASARLQGHPTTEFVNVKKI